MNWVFTSLSGLLFNCPSWIFYMLYCNSGAFLRLIILLKFYVPSRDFSFKVLQNFIVYESAEDRNLRALFNRVKNSSSCNIFTKTKHYVTFAHSYFHHHGDYISAEKFFFVRQVLLYFTISRTFISVIDLAILHFACHFFSFLVHSIFIFFVVVLT